MICQKLFKENIAFGLWSTHSGKQFTRTFVQTVICPEHCISVFHTISHKYATWLVKMYIFLLRPRMYLGKEWLYGCYYIYYYGTLLTLFSIFMDSGYCSGGLFECHFLYNG